MDKFNKKLKKQKSCYSCIKMTETLKVYSDKKSKLTNEIIEVHITLCQLKETLRDLKIESMGPNNALKERARMWQRPYSHFSTGSLEESYEIQGHSPTIASLPLVRPRKMRHRSNTGREEICTIREGCVELNDASVSGEQVKYDIPKVQPGCYICQNLEGQIKREIADLRSLEKRLEEKQGEVADHRIIVQGLQKQVTKHSKNSQFQTSGTMVSLSPLDKSPTPLPIKMSNSWSVSCDTGVRSVLLSATSLHERVHENSSLTDLLEEYQAISEEMKALLERQDSVIRLMCYKTSLETSSFNF